MTLIVQEVEGAVAVLTAADIPKLGSNNFCNTDGYDQEKVRELSDH